MKTYRSFVVPFDFSSHARAALDTAHDLARQLGADLHLLNVVEPPSAVYGYPGITPVPPLPIALDLHEVEQATLEALGEVAGGLDPLPGGLPSTWFRGRSSPTRSASSPASTEPTSS